MMTRRVPRFEGDDEADSMETHRMVAVGELPARDLEFEALLSRAAEFQKFDVGCKLRGAAAN